MATGAGGVLDRPTPLDPETSGTLRDDLDAWRAGAAPHVPPVYYASASADDRRLFLFYGVYYPADWSGPGASPRIDHRADFEGVLVVVGRGTASVEAVVTQAHRLFYLWIPAGAPVPAGDAVSGTVALVAGRPLLFAESGGHGLYSFGGGVFRPRGGRALPRGPAGVPRERLVGIAVRGTAPLAGLPPLVSATLGAEIRPLEELRRFTTEPGGGFAGVPRKATPPWLWRDRRGGTLARAGAIVLDPAGFYEAILGRRRP